MLNKVKKISYYLAFHGSEKNRHLNKFEVKSIYEVNVSQPSRNVEG